MKLLDQIWKKGQDFLGVRYPIISGAMTWVSDYQLVKAVSDAGAFPVLAGGNMPPDIFEAEVDRCVQNIKSPFAVNLITIAPSYRDHYEILRSKNVPFVVFAANFPKKKDVTDMKEAGKKVLSFASTDSIAEQMIRFGVDGLLLEGSEAGGHIGHVSLMILLQQVMFKVGDFPIFVAGGLATGQMMAHLLLMGAYGCQFGTLFAMCQESTAHPRFKDALRRARARQAIETPQYDARLPVVAVRAIKNAATQQFGRIQLDLLARLESGQITREAAQFEVETFWVGSLRRAVVDGDIESGSLMAGQSVGLVSEIRPIRDIIRKLTEEAEAQLEKVRKTFRDLTD
ncbi:nitronate monooxygenase [bacterium]|nr:nitronate monooxygenase [bacterium]